MKTLLIDKADEGQRLDRYLRKYLPSAPLSAIYKLARTGKIKINGKRVINEYRVEEGDLMDLHVSDDMLMAYQKTSATPVLPTQTKARLSDWILYEDASILAINKPSKINVHPGDHKSNEVSIIQMAHDYFEGKYSSPMFSPSLVHRIDRNTTGVLLIAKDRHWLNFLLDELQSHRMRKKYLALVTGKLQGNQTIRSPLLRIENAKNESKVRVDPNGQKAITHYKSLFASDKISLLEVELETGRMHQIRVHLSSIWHPILGDSVYGKREKNRELQIAWESFRQMLHARELAFVHPVTRKLTTIIAPIPEDMRIALEYYFPLLEAFDAL